MTKRLKKPCVQCAEVLFALFCVQMLMHLNVDNIQLDDWVFWGVLESGENLLTWLAGRWENWSSRLVIEAILCLITHSIWAFRMLDSAMMVLFAWALCRLAGSEKRPGMLALSSLLVTTIPFAMLRSTGWMATSLNYYWPISAVAVALVPLADSLWERKTERGVAAAAVLLSVLGAGQEQTSAVIVGSYLVLGSYLALKNKKVNRVHLVILAIAAVQLVLHLCCPGNAVRSVESAAAVNLRDYPQFSIVDKLSVCMTSTTMLLFFASCPVLLGCGALVASTIAARRRGAVAMMLALIPMGFSMFYRGTRHVSGLAFLSNYYSYVLQLGPERIQWGGQLAIMFVLIVLLGLMALALYLSVGHRPLAICAVFAYALGFAARMALSFSPTVVESGERTMLPLYGAMMLCSLLCVRDCRAEGARRWPLVIGFAVCVVLAGMNVLGSFALAA